MNDEAQARGKTVSVVSLRETKYFAPGFIVQLWRIRMRRGGEHGKGIERGKGEMKQYRRSWGGSRIVKYFFYFIFFHSLVKWNIVTVTM